ncbi:MAG: transposase [Syntrophales bacterium]|jgi:hypothetical protein|nr:transposase [Syntrophales bacterium]
MEKNRAIKRMEEINAIVDWTPIEDLLERTCPVGKSTEGNRAYPPILLMKFLLLQQWFRIDSDLELETRINDRISFKRGSDYPFPSRPHKPRALNNCHFCHFDRREPEGEIFQKKRQDNGKERFLVASLLEMTDLKVLIEMTDLGE